MFWRRCLQLSRRGSRSPASLAGARDGWRSANDALDEVGSSSVISDQSGGVASGVGGLSGWRLCQSAGGGPGKRLPHWL